MRRRLSVCMEESEGLSCQFGRDISPLVTAAKSSAEVGSALRIAAAQQHSEVSPCVCDPLFRKGKTESVPIQDERHSSLMVVGIMTIMVFSISRKPDNRSFSGHAEIRYMFSQCRVFSGLLHAAIQA